MDNKRLLAAIAISIGILLLFDVWNRPSREAQRQAAHARPVAALHGGQHQQGHACGARLGAYGVGIGGKLGGIQVAMGIDPAGHGMSIRPPHPGCTCPTITP